MTLTNRRLCEWILLLALVLLSSYPFMDPDGWWHLRTGQHILEAGSIPVSDIYSATQAGSQWVTHEWLSEVMMYALYSVGGFPVLTLVFGLVTATAFWITYRRSSGGPYLAGVATILGAAASHPAFGVRPQMLSLLFVAVVLLLLDRQSPTAETRAVWWLVPLTLLWVNLHGAFVLGLALVAIRIVGLVLDGWIAGDSGGWRSPSLRQLALVLGACLLVVPLNPNGARLYWYPFETMLRETERLYIQEWASPDFHMAMFYPFALLTLVVIATLGFSPKRPRPSTVLLLLGALLASLSSGRHIPIFALVAIPVLAEHWRVMLSGLGWGRDLIHSNRPVPLFQSRANVLLLCLMLILTVGEVGGRISGQESEEASSFPKHAVEWIEQNQVQGPIFNTYEWGGYLIWHLYPSNRTTLDGRPEVYGDAYVGEYLNALHNGVAWRELVDRLNIQLVLVRPEVAIASLLREQADWEQAFEDDVAVVFVRRETSASSKGLPRATDHRPHSRLTSL